MSDKDGTKVTESKEPDAKKSLSKKNVGVSGNNSGVSNTNANKDDKIKSAEPQQGAKSPPPSPSPSPSPTTSSSTKSTPPPSPSPSPSPTTSSSTKTETISTTQSPKQPRQQQQHQENPAISSTATDTITKSAALIQDGDHKVSQRIKTSDVSKSMSKYNKLVEDPVSIPQFTSNYFCFDCGAILTTLEDKEQHMIIETERRKNEKLVAEE